MKDYYCILNVPRDASAEQVRRAFRTLAFTCHPDVATPTLHNSQRFREIREAYDTLIEPSLRMSYDSRIRAYHASRWSSARGDHGTTSYSGGRRHHRHKEEPPSREDDRLYMARFLPEILLKPGVNDLETTLQLRPIETILPARYTLHIQSDKDPGQLLSRGLVQFPGKLWNGALLIVTGLGSYDAATGKRGNLAIRISILSGAPFEIQGSDVIYRHALPPWEIALGGLVEIPTLDGCERVRIQPGNISEFTIRLPGRGLYDSAGKRGTLIVKIGVDVSRAPTAKARKLWTQLAKEYDKG